MELINRMLKGDRLALARVISFIEDRGDELRTIVDAIYPKTGKAFVLGITGPPGAGKSTCTDRLIAHARKAGKTVAVIAIDPSSPFSGGAILGDRIRMQAHYGDPGVYIRSLGTRGKHGGLSVSSKEVVMALDAAGFDLVIVETAGVGQTELDILKLAHAICVILVPESGDGIQVMKAGLMEIADLFVVNKSDRPEADKLVRELMTMISMNENLRDQHDAEIAAHHGVLAGPASGSRPSGDSSDVWVTPVLKTQGHRDVGISELFDAIESFRSHGLTHGTFEQRRANFLRDEILEVIWSDENTKLRAKFETDKGRKLLNEVLTRKITPYQAAEKLKSL